MRRSEVAAILTKIRLYDSRHPEVTVEQTDAWHELYFMQANDFATVARAVTLFYEQSPESSGRSPFLDSHQLKFFILQAKREKERAVSKQRAILVSSGVRDVDEADTEARRMIEAGHGRA